MLQYILTIEENMEESDSDAESEGNSEDKLSLCLLVIAVKNYLKKM